MSAEIPVIAISAGDPAGIGGEVLAKTLASGALDGLCRPLIVGARWALDAGAEAARVELPPVQFVDVDVPRPTAFRFGEISAACGSAAVRAVEQAAGITARGEAAAMVTCPDQQRSRARSRLRCRHRPSGNPRAPHGFEVDRDDVDDAGLARGASVYAQVVDRGRALRNEGDHRREIAAHTRHARALGHEESAHCGRCIESTRRRRRPARPRRDRRDRTGGAGGAEARHRRARTDPRRLGVQSCDRRRIRSGARDVSRSGTHRDQGAQLRTKASPRRSAFRSFARRSITAPHSTSPAAALPITRVSSLQFALR